MSEMKLHKRTAGKQSHYKEREDEGAAIPLKVGRGQHRKYEALKQKELRIQPGL